MSFFDDEGDEPPTRATRPRRPAEPRAGAASGRPRGAPGHADAQQLMVRRAVALGIGALALVLVVVGVNGCLNSRAKNALRDYNRNVSTIVQDSNDQVSRRLFDLLANSEGSAQDLQQSVNQVRVTADEDVRRAKALSVPGDMRAAQEHLLLALTLRAEGVAKVSDELLDLTGNQKAAAVRRIAGDMRLFLTSDIVFSQRIVPYIQEALADHDIGGQQITSSQFLPDDTWLDPDAVGSRLGVAGVSARDPDAPVRPGTHGHGLTSVKVGSQTLTPGTQPNRVAATAATAFTVDFQNQGENDEFDVTVAITISGSGSPVTVRKKVDTTRAGQSAVAQLRLTSTPPIGTAVRVRATVTAVPGEKTTDNNTQTYVVIFTR